MGFTAWIQAVDKSFTVEQSGAETLVFTCR